MAVNLKLKRSHTHSTLPTTSDLVEGEFAVNTYDRKLFMRDSSNGIINVSNHYATDFESATKTFYVTVASKDSSHPYNGVGSGNGYKINGIFSPYLHLIPRNTYKFDQSDSSNSGHPLRFYLDASKTTAFTTGVTTSGTPGSSGAYTQIVVSDTTPSVLHYQCSAHGNMGWAATTGTRNLTSFDTDDLSEGSSNLYHTTARVNSAIDSRVDASFINNLTIVADTATALANARTIGGVSFDGTANINLPGVNASGNQDTSGNAATATALETARTIHGVSFDGTGNIDLSEVIQDTVGAMFSGNTETNITVTYQDSDGTIDLDVSAAGIASVAADSTPQLGGDLDVNGNAIVSASNGNIAITPNGSGDVIIDGLKHPQADGNAGQVLKTDGSGQLAFASVSSLAGAGIQNVSDDSSPQLGADLDVVTHSIVSTSNRNISITPNGSGSVIIDGLSHPQADGNAGQVLKTDGSGQLGFASVSSLSGAGIQNLSDDSSPQLGGNLDLVTHNIVTTSNRDINLLPNGSGKVVVGTNGIEFGDGTIQTSAGATQGFAIAVGVALG